MRDAAASGFASVVPAGRRRILAPVACDDVDRSALPPREDGPRADEEPRLSVRHFRDLLQHRRDDLIDTEIDAAPTAASARRLLQLAYAASEFVSGEPAAANGVRLCCLPLLFEFPEALPATQLDAALLRLARHDALGLPGADGDPSCGSLGFAPVFLEAGDLVDLRLSAVLRGAVALSSWRSDALPPPHPFVRKCRPQRRSRSFLRYLVGLQQWPPAGLQAEYRKRIARALGQELAGNAATVRTFCEGSYHDSLYEGMWAFQTRDLQQVALHHAQRAPADVAISVLGVVGSRARPGIKIGFGLSDSGQPHYFQLRCPPFEDLERDCRRVAGIIERAGVRVYAGLDVAGSIIVRL